MRFGRRTLVSTGLGLLLGATMATGTTGVVAQDATPAATPVDAVEALEPRPAHIHAGSCPDVGEIVAPLNDLAEAGGEAVAAGAVTETAETGGILVQYSFTTVPLPLDQILAGEHAINVHESAENIDNYIACGDLTGTLDANGSLVVGLGEVDDSGYAGIAVLSPSATAGSTDVSVFVSGELMDDGGANGGV